MIHENTDEAIEEALRALEAEFEALAGACAIEAARFEPIDDEPTVDDIESMLRWLAD